MFVIFIDIESFEAALKCSLDMLGRGAWRLGSSWHVFDSSGCSLCFQSCHCWLLVFFLKKKLMKFIRYTSLKFGNIIFIWFWSWQYGISPAKLMGNQKLSSFFEILTTSTDENDEVFNVIFSYKVISLIWLVNLSFDTFITCKGLLPS